MSALVPTRPIPDTRTRRRPGRLAGMLSAALILAACDAGQEGAETEAGVDSGAAQSAAASSTSGAADSTPTPPTPDAPRDVPFLAEPDPTLEDAVRAASPDYTTELVDVTQPGQQARYVYGRTDLNEDGVPETFVYMLGSIFCGSGGCDLMLFTGGTEGAPYRLIQTFPISRTPVIVSPDRTGGWNDLVRSESGGGAPSSYLRHYFDGTQYVEVERTVVGPDTEAPPGVEVLSGEVTYDAGVPLAPGG